MPRPSGSVVRVRALVPLGGGRDGTSFFVLRLERPPWEDSWRPGQFVMVRPFSFGLEVPWGRPFGICDMSRDELVCFFRSCGRGTRRIANLREGEQARVWGPLGNGFAVEDRPTLLLAGGMGLAPFVGYVRRHPNPAMLAMLFGHRDPAQCFPLDLIGSHIGLESMSEEGPADLERFIAVIGERMAGCARSGGIALACGPLPFLRTVQKFSADLGLPAQLSLENRMACGLGACLGCVARTGGKWPVEASRNGYVQVCSNGPVFWADQIEL